MIHVRKVLRNANKGFLCAYCLNLYSGSDNSVASAEKHHLASCATGLMMSDRGSTNLWSLCALSRQQLRAIFSA